jgi:hypothetical protein
VTTGLRFISAKGHHTNHTVFECPSTDFIIGNRFDSSENLHDNSCLAAIRDALRHFCANDNHEQLPWDPFGRLPNLKIYGPLTTQPTAKLQLPTRDFRIGGILPARPARFVFQKPRYGSHRDLAAVKSLRSAAEVGST